MSMEPTAKASGACLCGSVKYEVNGPLRGVIYCHCEQCGSNMFWSHNDSPRISIMAGSFEMPTGLSAEAHIFVADASDYYTIDDDLPQHPDYGAIDAAE